MQIALRVGPVGAALVDRLLPHLRALSLTKCGSNVGETLLSRTSHEQLARARAALDDADGTLDAHCFAKHVLRKLSSM